MDAHACVQASACMAVLPFQPGCAYRFNQGVRAVSAGDALYHKEVLNHIQLPLNPGFWFQHCWLAAPPATCSRAQSSLLVANALRCAPPPLVHPRPNHAISTLTPLSPRLPLIAPPPLSSHVCPGLLQALHAARALRPPGAHPPGAARSLRPRARSTHHHRPPQRLRRRRIRRPPHQAPEQPEPRPRLSRSGSGRRRCPHQGGAEDQGRR